MNETLITPVPTADIAERLTAGDLRERHSCCPDISELPADAPAIVTTGWRADDGNAEVEYPHAADGHAAAAEYVRTGDWGERDATKWLDVWAWRVAYVWNAADETWDSVILDREKHTITLDPVEPDCDGKTHNWLSCDTWPTAHGGGVIDKDVCTHCGMYRVRNTWAQRPDTGEQGLESISYEPADDDSLALVEERQRAADDEDENEDDA